MGPFSEVAYRAGDGCSLVCLHADVESSRVNRLSEREFIYTEHVRCYNLLVEVDRHFQDPERFSQFMTPE